MPECDWMSDRAVEAIFDLIIRDLEARGATSPSAPIEHEEGDATRPLGAKGDVS